MVILDPRRELPTEPELPELPAPHAPGWWKWLLAFVVATTATFSVILFLLARGYGGFMVIVVAPVLFVFTLLLVRAMSERAR